MSDTTTPEMQFAQALSQFQANMPVIPKNRTGQDGNRRFKYADITDITRTCSPLLSKVGLSISGATQVRDGRTILAMRLIHTSGSRETAELDVTAPAGAMKTMGANLTYARRYLYGVLTGIVTDDDTDSEGTAVQEAPEPRSENLRTEAQIAEIHTIIEQGVDVDGIMYGLYGPDVGAKNITAQQANRLIDACRQELPTR